VQLFVLLAEIHSQPAFYFVSLCIWVSCRLTWLADNNGNLFSAGYLSVAVYFILTQMENPLLKENHYTTRPGGHPTLEPRTTNLPKEIIGSVRWLIGPEWSSTQRGWMVHW
jgi:hypothetical protein